MYLSIIIPAYNEERRIVKTLRSIDSYCKKSNFDYEILVVNDGSTDNTVKVVDDLKIDNLRIINNNQNVGKGYVVRQGLLAGKGKYRLFTDADNSTPIEELDKFLPYLEENDVLIASRNLKGAITPVAQPFYRKILGGMYRFLTKSIVGLRMVKDSQCGFKVLNEKVVNNVLSKCVINGLSFDVEILIIAQKFGYKIKEIPVTWIDDKDSKVTFSRMKKAVYELFYIRWNLIRGIYWKS